ncbi:conserved hypothetical protein [Theileria orientalis strain Shintoku]|uniref:Uncharacterized protein n=1 Tax=Theileria orientalis strain Shintoku TaxID=869250 RepID=J4C918_THEOR|nr:conserved hypothetical protein [Theileria orientalis strain Shintoku]BAM41763.1 conserved hypothetical protein [Theileria orientalis strain Shintoku]|eukprot:XP_009692064.1 conserved hypothetical protein [Theileria orientalis strain Shintoku]
MVSKFRSGSHILIYGFNTNNKESLNKFVDAFNESYNHLYLTSNWNDLKKFVNDSFVALESLTQDEYSRNSESLLINNFNTLSTINCSLNVDDSMLSFASNNDLLYSNILCEFDNAVESLIQLGIVHYYLRIEMNRYIVDNIGGLGKIRKTRCHNVYRDLYCRGIYIYDFAPVDGPGIIRHVVEYWKNQIDLEVWSLLVKILVNVDSIYNLINKIDSMPLSLRLKMFFRVTFMFNHSSLSVMDPRTMDISEGCWDRFEQNFESAESVDSMESTNAVYSRLNDKKSLEKVLESISKTYIVSHVFSSSFNFQCFFIEGMLLFSQLCKDFYHEVFSRVYSILFDVLQIFVSINFYYRYYNKKEMTNKLLYGCLGLCKLYFKHYNFIPPVLQLVYNQHRRDMMMNSVWFESLMPVFSKDSSLVSNFKNPILGFCKISAVLKSDLEYNFLFHASNSFDFDPQYYEYFVMNPNTQINDSNYPVQFHLNFTTLELLRFKGRSPTRSGEFGTLVINGTKISKFNESQDAYNHTHFMRSLYNMSSNARITNVTRIKYLRRYYGLYFRTNYDGSWVSRQYPDKILVIVISCCFMMDDIYSFIHYSQSLEYLQYKDTLKSKNRAIVRTLLPFVPNRSSKDAKKILLFQKHIKKRLRFSLMYSKNFMPFIPNLNKNHRPLSKFIFKSEPKPKCEIYLNESEEGGTKISFKITVTRDIRSSPSALGVKSLKNPLLSSSKASYGHHHNHAHFRNNRANRRSISRYNTNLNAFLNTHATGENIDNNRFFGSGSKCIHSSMGSSFKACNFCNNLNNFRHISHLLHLIDLLSHHLFTLNLSCGLDYSLHFRNTTLREAGCPKLSDQTHNVTVNTGDLASRFSDIISQIDRTFSSTYSNYHFKGQYPFRILNEIMENTVLLSLSTVFHEKYYNHLLSRLAIYNLVKGRFNIAVTLIKRTLSDSNMYNINYGASDSHLKENYLCEIDRRFKIQILSKIYIELLNDLHSFRELFACTDSKTESEAKDETSRAEVKTGCSLDGNTREHNKDGHEAHEEYYFGYRMGLMKAFAHLKEASSKLMESLSILDSSYRKMACDMPGGESYRQLFANTAMPLEGDAYRRALERATESLLRTVSLDPLDHKAWYYLAQCSLYSNDLHFAHGCCKRSIECFDSCVASWITRVICCSARVRTCAPFHTNDEHWEEYVVKRSFENSVSFVSLPSPFEPLLPLHISSFEGLESHFKKCVGDDNENCMFTLRSLENHGNVYVASAILQLVTRNSASFNAFFPWELPYLGAAQPKYRHGLSQNYDTTLPGTPRGDRFSAEFTSSVKRMVSSSVESNYPVCAVPFINLVLETFLNKQFNLQCRHHADRLFSYNSGVLSQSFLEEELYGWATCIECLAQIGEAELSQILLPVLELYLEYYSLDKNRKRAEKNVCRSLHFNRNDKKLVRSFFSDEPVGSTDFMLESKYLTVYTWCYNTGGSADSLKSLLQHVRNGNSRGNYTKFVLLENRLLVGLKEYEKSVQLSNQLHRNAMKISQSTDFDLEYRSLLAFAHSLKMVGEADKSKTVGDFAHQMHMTTPVLKLDLCLNIPL